MDAVFGEGPFLPPFYLITNNDTKPSFSDAREEMLENETPMPSEQASLVDSTLPSTTYQSISTSPREEGHVRRRHGFRVWLRETFGRRGSGGGYQPVAEGD
jgi:hypothetical protein